MPIEELEQLPSHVTYRTLVALKGHVVVAAIDAAVSGVLVGDVAMLVGAVLLILRSDCQG